MQRKITVTPFKIPYAVPIRGLDGTVTSADVGFTTEFQVGFFEGEVMCGVTTVQDWGTIEKVSALWFLDAKP